MRSRDAILIAALLLMSAFWPVGAMAQENPAPVSFTGSFCPLSGLQTLSLSPEQAIAIQGIVQQDVAASAEKYERQQLLAELGATPKTESQKLAEKYNMYFIGPDGVVSYAQKLSDSPDEESLSWLLGTAIDGRVEYGGALAEDVIQCPSMTTGESGMCTGKAGTTEDDLHIKDWTVSLEFVNSTDPGSASPKAVVTQAAEGALGTAASAGSSWITIVNWLAFRDPVDAWQSIKVDQSRLTAEKWRTTLAVNPNGGAVFVLPRTYLYFTARMKRLAVFDSAVQTVFMLESFGTMLGPLISKVGSLKSLMKKSVGSKVSTLFDSTQESFRNSARQMDDVEKGLGSPKSYDSYAKKLKDLLKGGTKTLDSQSEAIRLQNKGVIDQVFDTAKRADFEDWGKHPSEANARAQFDMLTDDLGMLPGTVINKYAPDLEMAMKQDYDAALKGGGYAPETLRSMEPNLDNMMNKLFRDSPEAFGDSAEKVLKNIGPSEIKRMKTIEDPIIAQQVLDFGSQLKTTKGYLETAIENVPVSATGALTPSEKFLLKERVAAGDFNAILHADPAVANKLSQTVLDQAAEANRLSVKIAEINPKQMYSQFKGLEKDQTNVLNAIRLYPGSNILSPEAKLLLERSAAKGDVQAAFANREIRDLAGSVTVPATSTAPAMNALAGGNTLIDKVTTLEKQLGITGEAKVLSKSKDELSAIASELDALDSQGAKMLEQGQSPEAVAEWKVSQAKEMDIAGRSRKAFTQAGDFFSPATPKSYQARLDDLALQYGVTREKLPFKTKLEAAGTLVNDWTRSVLSGDASAMAAKHFTQSTQAAKFATLGTRLILTSWLRTLYTVNRRVVLIAYGLHNIGTVFEQEGYLTMHSPGLTLEWDKDVTNAMFTKYSSILLYGTKKDMSVLAQVGPGGFFMDDIKGMLSSFGVEPTTATKFSSLGDNLAFGGVMYNNYPELVKLTEKPSGITRFDQYKGGYMLRIRGWDNHALTMIEDPASMKALVKGSLVSALGMRTSNVDMYKHAFTTPSQVENAFPKTWLMSSKLTDWGLHTNLVTAGSTLFFVQSLGLAAKMTLGLTTASLVSKGAFGSGESFLTSQVTSMKDLQACYSSTESKGGLIDCKTATPCELVEAKCEAEIGSRSMYLTASSAVQMTADAVPALMPAALALGLVDFVVMEGVHAGPVEMEGKIAVSQRCMADLLTCKERSFIVIGGSQVDDPQILAAEESQVSELKGLPGLEDLPIKDFIEGFADQMNITDNLFQPGQMQTNIHSEMDYASGRMAFKNVFYVHLKDVVVDWLDRSDLPLRMCPLSGGHAQAEQCISLEGEALKLGNRTLLSSQLVPFKWMDELMPALVIPNTVVTLPVGSSCDLFTVDSGTQAIKFNPSVVSKFESENFVELERLMGTMRDLETDQGAIYLGFDYEGRQRFEMDHTDGRMIYSSEPLSVTGSANVTYANESFGFKSAVFTGGTIVKRGDKIYIVPRYFRPTLSGKQWLQATAGTPFVSTTGNEVAAFNDQGQLMGIDATQTGIPGGDKLGTITRVDAEKDLNGDGVIQDNEKSGWRFYQEGNQTKFDLWYNGQKETYDGSQVEVDKATGDIKVYEKDAEHVDANLVRTVETSVDSLGRTLMTIKDGQGNTLLEEALVTYLKGTGGAIRYDSANNNYVFVNGQPVEVNNDFKTNGFNAVTGRTEPPLLQPSAVSAASETYKGEEENAIPAVPIRPEEGAPLAVYALLIVAGLLAVRFYRKT
jgi:hypothetical protein